MAIKLPDPKVPEFKTFTCTMFVGVSYRVIGDGKTHITCHPYMIRPVLGWRIKRGETRELERDPFLVASAD